MGNDYETILLLIETAETEIEIDVAEIEVEIETAEAEIEVN